MNATKIALAALAMACLWAWQDASAQTTKPTEPSVTATKTTVTETKAPEANEPLDPVEAAIENSKNPVPWLKWGADLRAREEYFNNAINLNKEAANHEYNFQRYRSRLWATVTPVDNIDINARLVWEPRHYCKPDSKPNWATNDVLFDQLNVSFKKLMGQDWTVTVGRQDIKLGDGWLVLEGTPEDGSRTISFDAIRSTYELKDLKTTIDTIYIDQDTTEDQYLKPFNNDSTPLRSNDERGAILYVSNKSIKDTTLDGYYMWKHDSPDERIAGVTPDQAELHTFGTRVEHDFDKNWRARGEIAEQLGHKDGHDVCAFGANTRLTYFFRDAMDNQLRTGYEYLSGDDPGTDTNEQFNLLWGRYPQWSDLYVYTYASETRIADTTNLHHITVLGWTIKPVKPMEISLDYHLLFADENTRRSSAQFSNHGSFRGQLFTAIAKYKFNNHVSTHVLGEVFGPGNYYNDRNNDVAAYARWEWVFTW